jgi:hypothetical protein
MEMNIFRLLAGAVLALALGACGGGGGSPGTVIGGPGGGDNGTSPPLLVGGTLVLDLVRADGTVVSDNKLSQTEEVFLKATVKNIAGAAVDLARVSFELDSAEAILVPVNGAALTRSGLATIKVAPASVGAQGVVTAKASVTLNGEVITDELFLEISPGVVDLTDVSVTPAKVQKGQIVNASVEVLVNQGKAGSNSVGVVFSSTCGDVSPTTSLVDQNGIATAVIQTNAVGNCTVRATYNATSKTSDFVVDAPPITGIEFVSASPSVIYQKDSTAIKTSIVSFRVIDSLGAGVPSIPVSATLTNSDGGINFCGSPSSAVNSNANGNVSFSVCSGTLPATVQVRASIDGSDVYTNSNLLTIQTGLPTQRFFDISASQFNFYAGGEFTSKINGNEVTITVFAADRQGNPVPPGTPIVFVAEGGQIVSSGLSSCVIGDNGRCSVKLVGQDYRPLGSGASKGDPRPGRVTVLAYADGEESFIDANFNNRFDFEDKNANGVYDAGEELELFEDLGIPFMDKDEDDVFSASYKNLFRDTDEGEFKYFVDDPAFKNEGGSSCAHYLNNTLSVENTCNGKWDGLTKVRRDIVIVFSGGEIGRPGSYHVSIPPDKHTQVIDLSRTGFFVQLSDYNGNPLPASTELSVEVVKVKGDCSATLIGNVVGSSTEPTFHQILLEKCGGPENGEVVYLKAKIQNRDSIFPITVP